MTARADPDADATRTVQRPGASIFTPAAAFTQVRFVSTVSERGVEVPAHRAMREARTTAPIFAVPDTAIAGADGVEGALAPAVFAATTVTV